MSELSVWLKKNWKLFFIMLLAVASRSVLIGKIPCGVHADEAFAGYEAYSMMKYGTDSWGYTFPVYLTTWGSGMSVLESYLMVPFIWFGGLNLVTVRLPQMIMGVISVFVVYLLYRRIADHDKALWAAALIAVCPWHIMMSRWGLDANLAPAFILLAMYFAVLGLSKEKYLVVSSLFWGLSLYCYALMWLFVPFFLLFSLWYCIKYHKIRISKCTISAAAILFLLAVPLLMFVAVNIGLMPEIKTPYLSIPRLVQFRGDELGGTHILPNLKDFLRIYIKQDDYNLMNGIPYFGLYYLFSLPFILLGAYDIIKTVWCNGKQKKFGYETFLVIWAVICTVIGLLRSMSIYRANCMNLAMLFFLIRGCYRAGQIVRIPWVRKGILVLYFAVFCLFEGYYFTAYRDTIKEMQLAGAEEALAYAVEMKEEGGRDISYMSEEERSAEAYRYFRIRMESFEKLDVIGQAWREEKQKLYTTCQESDYLTLISDYMKSVGEREYEYEHLLVYFTFRYLMRAYYDDNLFSKAQFAVYSVLMLRDMDAVRYHENGGKFELKDRIDDAWMYSREVEHSEENMELLDEEFQFEDAYRLEQLQKQLRLNK